MTAPLSVGQVSVEVVADVSRLARDLKAKVEAAFRDLNLSQAIQDAVSKQRIQVPVDVDVDLSRVQAKLRSLAGTVTLNATVNTSQLVSSARRSAKLAQAATPPIQVPVQAGGGSAVSSMLQNLAGAASSVGSQLGGVAQSLGNIGSAAGTAAIAVGIVAGIGFAASAAVPMVYTLAGALASLPGLIAGAAAGFGALKLGFAGISDAFKKRAGGGSGGGGGGGESEVARARRIAAAERGVEAARRGIAAASRGLQAAQRGLTEAQESYTEALAAERRAQEAVARARKTAQERIDDLGRSLRGAVLDEKEAAVELQNAQRDLAAARTTFNPELIRDAELRYERAQLAVEEAADAVADLGEESADAGRKGIEGSDEVVQALRDQKDAQKAVRDAAVGIIDAQDRVASANDAVKASYDSLASAQDALAQAKERAAAAGGGGGGGLADDVVKLAPAAQEFVDAIKRLKPAFEELRLLVQQRLFEGLGKVVTDTFMAWQAPLKTVLGNFAGTFNALFKNLGATLQKQPVIDGLVSGAETVRENFQRIGEVITGPLLEAFANLSKESEPFIDAIGGSIASGLQSFADKINAMAADGRLKKFFEDATGYFNDLKGIAKDVGSILGSFLAILTESEQGNDESPFKQFAGFLDELAVSLQDPATREAIRGYIEDFKDFAAGVGDAIRIGAQLYGVLERIGFFAQLAWGPFGQLVSSIERATGLNLSPLSLVGRLFDVDWAAIGNTIKTKAGQIGSAIWEGLKAGWEAVANVGSWIASKLWSGPDSLVGKVKSGLGIASPSRVFMQIGRDVIQGLLNGLAAMFGSLGATARTIPGRIRDAVGNAGATLVQKGRDFVGGLRNGISGMAGSLQSTASSLRGRVTAGLGQVGSLLYGAGQAIISGLINGIRSMIGSLGSYLGSVGQYIKDNKGPIEKDRRLLIPEGAAIMEGLIAGIASRRGQLGTELGDVSDLISSSIVADPYGIYAQAEAAFSAGMTVSAPPNPELAWATGATGDQILDAIRGMVVIRYGGDTQVALGDGRRR